eukprot:TRINITY_DN2388_c0_g1_i4.p1 TRINITY_DN2388_c0_g1~~TRINITY_DN2388_c0_g1_i4.p1  ORF type:complete len:110 (+),score=26.90 TRINITY_DN2388_c0_g1_i4:442-771(+)
MWRDFQLVFNWLPIAAVLKDAIFFVHGGLSPELRTLGQIRAIQRPIDVPDRGLLPDLLWSIPDEQAEQWVEQDRGGTTLAFGPKVVKKFLEENNLQSMVCSNRFNLNST